MSILQNMNIVFLHHKLQTAINFLLAVCVFVSCSKSSTGIVKLEPTNTIKAFSDTIYLSSQVSNLTYTDGKYYLSDYYKGIVSFKESFDSFRIEQVNAFLTLMPQCYMFATSGKNDIYIYDVDNRLFLNVQDTSLSQKIESGRHEVSSASRFVLNGDSILCPITKNKMTIAIFHNGKTSGTCCPTINGVDDVRKPYHSERIIIRDEEHYYTIGKGIPIVQMFSQNLELLSSYNLKEIEEIAKTVEQEKSDKPNSYFVVVQDACVANGKLFLLISSKNNNKYRCNNVVTLKTANNTIEFDEIYELKGDVYSTLCVNGKGQIVIVNAKTASVEVYEL